MKADWRSLLGGLALVLATVAVYVNSLDAPFVFDDMRSIQENQSIRRLWPLSVPLSPPANGEGVTGRPIINLSLAINYAFGGLEVRGYHGMNLALHALAGLTFWGIVRRTLRQPVLAAQFQGIAEWVAWTMAALWLVHPLLTESVVCVIQRTEVIGGLFYLLTLYGFVRATESDGWPWPVVTVLAAVVGMASKEIVASAPLLALLYDRTFVSGTFRDAWRKRKGLYLAMAATWLLLAWLMLHNQQRGRTVGFGLGVSSWDYLLTQSQALTIYLKLSLWPHPLIVDYGSPVVRELGAVWWRGLIILALLGGTGVALWRRPVLGFIGAWFFVILAPSSSIVPLTTQTIAEHRMYLPLLSVIVLVVGVAAIRGGRRAVWAMGLLAVGAGWLTVQRNEDYRDDLTLWGDTVAKYPENSRARAGLATALYERGKFAEARVHYAESLRLDPASAPKQYNMGLVLDAMGEGAGAMGYYREAIRLLPTYAPAHANLAAILVEQGQPEAAIPHLKEAISAMPQLASAHYTLGRALVGVGRPENAEVAYTEALRIQPNYAEARLNLGIVFAQQGKLAEALQQLTETVRRRPDAAEAHANLGNVLTEVGRLPEAVASYETALRLRPDYALTHFNLGNALVQLQRYGDARNQFAEAMRLAPDFAEAREMWERLRDAP